MNFKQCEEAIDKTIASFKNDQVGVILVLIDRIGGGAACMLENVSIDHVVGACVNICADHDIPIEQFIERLKEQHEAYLIQLLKSKL